VCIVPIAVENQGQRKLRVAVIVTAKKRISESFLLERLNTKFGEMKNIEMVVVDNSYESTIVDKWALDNHIKVIKVPPPDWVMYGNGGGHVCNIMVQCSSDYGIFFWINKSSDIKDLMKQFDATSKKYQVYQSRL